MATLRPVEERDAKGNTTRLNPAITWKQDREIRKVRGRHDFDLIENPDFHTPITAQVQNGKIVFFTGMPDTTQTRALAKEIPMTEVPEYIIKELTRNPMKVREQRPTVYEVRIATIGDVEVTTLGEMEHDGQSVTVEPIAPNLRLKPHQGGAPVAATEV